MDKVVGLDDARAELVIVKTPDGSGELTKFHTPAGEKRACPAPANRLRIRHIAFVVHDLDTIVNGSCAKGLDLVGKIQNLRGHLSALLRSRSRRTHRRARRADRTRATD
jgi:hypothetical protein